jgi:hypothetical protein
MFEGPQSGKFGVLHADTLPITHMFNWTIDSIDHSPETYYASNTLGAPDRNPGVINWTGNFSVFDGKYLIFPGQFLYSLEMFTAPRSGVYGNTGPTYAAQAIVESNTITWAWGEEQSLTQVINIAGNGCILGRERVIDDLGTLTPAKMCGLQLQTAFGAAATPWQTLNNIQQAVLTVTSANQPFVNSSTGCCTHRRPGNIDWTLALTYTDHRIITIARTDLVSFRTWISPTQYWDFIYGIIMSASNIVADRQSGSIESQVGNFQMKALSGEGTRGSISYFNGTAPVAIWPPVATTNTVPGPPQTVAAGLNVGDNNDVDVTWSVPVTGDPATAYSIWASPDGIDYSCIGYDSVPDLAYTDVGVGQYSLPGGTDWWYKVAGINAQGQGEFSAPDGPLTVTPV